MHKLLVAAVLAIGAATPAAADEYQPGTQPRTIPSANLTVNDNQLPVSLVTETDAAYLQYNDARYGGQATFGGAQIERAAYCLGCHIEDNVADSPGRTWAGSMMANAARDPLMYAALAVANQDVPGVGGDFCLRCHSPSGFTQGHTMMNPPTAFNGVAVAADSVNNPNRYPCNQYEPGSMTLCKCNVASCAPGSGNETNRDFCLETDNAPGYRVSNGYCMINFGDNAMTGAGVPFRGHPDNPTYYHDEVYEQLFTGQKFVDVGPEDASGSADPADDSEGLQCAFCHRLDPAKNGTTRLYGGNYWLSVATTWPGGAAASNWAAPRTVRFGPYAKSYTNCTNANTTTPDVDCDSTTGSAHRHPVQQSALHTSGTLCGICHDVTNPSLKRLTPGGQLYTTTSFPSGFNMPIERTFSEWNASSYGPGGATATQKSCQGCHMTQPAAPTPACLALNTNSYNRPTGDGSAATPGFARHIFVGGNVWLPSVFRDIIQPIAGTGDPQWLYNLVTIADNIAGNVQRQQSQAYDFTVQAATALLHSAATLALNGAAPATTTSGGNISFSVRVTNNSGHKLPTGYPEGRRMWLAVSARVPSDPSTPPPFFQSGAWNMTSGVLTRDPQLKIYEVALGVSGAAMEPYPTQFHFARNQIVFQDNRIPPLGFDTTNPKYDEMAPVLGSSTSMYPVLPTGRLPNWDDTSYSIPVPATATGDVQVTVALLYQTASKDYIDFLANNNSTNERGADMRTVWNNHGKSPPVVMATQTFTVTNTAPFVGPIDMATTTQDLSASVEDMAAPGGDNGDLAAPGNIDNSDMSLTRKPAPKHGCGVSVAGADWTDLGPLALLLVGGALVGRRRRRARS